MKHRVPPDLLLGAFAPHKRGARKGSQNGPRQALCCALARGPPTVTLRASDGTPAHGRHTCEEAQCVLHQLHCATRWASLHCTTLPPVRRPESATDKRTPDQTSTVATHFLCGHGRNSLSLNDLTQTSERIKPHLLPLLCWAVPLRGSRVRLKAGAI